jgi:hypothetical protein
MSHLKIRPTRRRRPLLPGLASAVVVVALAVLAFGLTLANLTGHATPAPAAPSIAILPTTTLPTATGPRPGSAGYVPTPAGPPATDSDGAWIPEPDPASPASSTAGGGC